MNRENIRTLIGSVRLVRPKFVYYKKYIYTYWRRENVPQHIEMELMDGYCRVVGKGGGVKRYISYNNIIVVVADVDADEGYWGYTSDVAGAVGFLNGL